MDETPEPVKKHRGWPKGKPRGKKVRPMPTFLPAPEPEAPIHVRLRLKNYPVPVEFGCAEHTVENGFHVFMYPSERDRYRTTRREFAISEIIEVEITEARHSFSRTQPTGVVVPDTWGETVTTVDAQPVPAPRGPIIHSVKKHAAGVLSALETSSGPIKMDTMPGLTFGGHDG